MPTDFLLPPSELDALAERLGGHNAGGTGSGQPVTQLRHGMVHYSPHEIWQEVVYLAFFLHWELDSLLSLEHGDRRRLVAEVARLDQERLRHHG